MQCTDFGCRDDLEAAKLNLKEGITDHLITGVLCNLQGDFACLALEFKAYKQHAQVIGNINKDFVHTGIFPKEISRAQEVRHASDYDDFYIVSIEEARSNFIQRKKC